MEVGSAEGSTSNYGNDYLEQFKLLAKTTSGKATAAIIDKVMRHKHIFVFTDLLELECVQQLRDTESHSTLRALEILSHGVYANYLKEKDSLPPFTDVQLNKLRQLTILSLAAKTKILYYDDLHKALGVSSVRELEDLLIESYNSGLVDGKIDHRNKRFVVDNTSSRDVDSSDLDAMIGKIQAWCTDSDRLLATIDKARLDVQDSRQRIQKAKAAQKEAADRAGNDPNVPHSTPSISVQSKMESSAGPTSMDLA